MLARRRGVILRIPSRHRRTLVVTSAESGRTTLRRAVGENAHSMQLTFVQLPWYTPGPSPESPPAEQPAAHGASSRRRSSPDPRRSTSASVSRRAGTRRARTNARRRMAASRHSVVSCTHAPLPGRTARSSITSAESRATTRRSAERGARRRHPTHVRTGSMNTPGPVPAGISGPRGCCPAGCRSSRR